MKTPPRRFIVEFKPARRRPKERTNSVWGNTDLKALTREVEEMAPHLFNLTEETVSPNAGYGPQASPNAEFLIANKENVELGRAAVKPAESSEVALSRLHNSSHSAVDAAEQLQETPPVSHTRTSSKQRISRKLPERLSLDVHENSKERAENVESAISRDELATLEAENKRLKRLLAERILAQNLQLKKMLDRFNVN
ncbi:hypothetical protein [Sinorhizobium sp. BJ1]|uniref:hypothetical protein n=1 Tax=Sinorhizobium sp. BJ1 TaxID=2035455 RepID=UPI000615224F|nr:hypothetical protein [Sinorhizobium sp. BJ1]